MFVTLFHSFLLFLLFLPFLPFPTIPTIPTMFLDFYSPFMDISAREMVHTLQSQPFFVSKPAYLDEAKRTFLPIPTTCEGGHCTRCKSPILRTNSPMEFYNDPDMCCEEHDYDDCDDYDVYDVYDDEQYDSYIDSVLDNDYDY